MLSTALKIEFHRLRFRSTYSKGGARLATRMRVWRARSAIISAAVVMTGGWLSPASAETIEAALARGYRNNPQLNAQRAIVRQTDEGVPQALSGYRPSINANASAGK